MSTLLSDESKVYFLSRTWRITFIVLAVILLAMTLLPVLLSLRISGTPFEFMCLFAFVFGLSGWCLYEAVFNRIVTSPQGIEYFFALYKIRTSWSNVKHLEVNSYGVVNLVLHEPSLKGLPLFSWYFRIFGYDRLIQLSPYVNDWKASQLVQDIKKHAPHAFEPH